MSKENREAIIRRLEAMYGEAEDKDNETKEALFYSIEALKEERTHGEWIRRHYITDTKSFDMYVCSNCGEEFSYDAETGVSMNNYNTCPKCGSDNRKRGEAE